MSDPTVTAIAAICIAAITTCGGVVVAIIQSRKVDKVGEKIGTPNGKGNLVEMAEHLLDGQSGQDMRLASIEHRISEIEHCISEVDSNVHDHGRRIYAIERWLQENE